MQHHAFVIPAEAEEGIKTAETYIEKEVGMKVRGNPDVVVLRYGLLSVEDARSIFDIAAQAPVVGETRVIIIVASRAYHEAQNALLKLFEEPPKGTVLFLILPSIGGLLPTLRSRVQVLKTAGSTEPGAEIPEVAEKFLDVTKEKRSAMIKKLASGKDEDERRANRDEAIAIINGVEQAAHAAWKKDPSLTALLSDIETLRGHLYDRSAPVRMILEHVSLVLPKGLGK